jgi:hypothetical protein
MPVCPENGCVLTVATWRLENFSTKLLIIKCVYLICTSELEELRFYFYTNDLKVLVDVIMREVSDLDAQYEHVRPLESGCICNHFKLSLARFDTIT